MRGLSDEHAKLQDQIIHLIGHGTFLSSPALKVRPRRHLRNDKSHSFHKKTLEGVCFALLSTKIFWISALFARSNGV